jgi:adenine-specific DNA-methyltransferase
VQRRLASVRELSPVQMESALDQTSGSLINVSTFSASPAPLNGRFTSLSAEKLRGGYYTPTSIANWLAKWGVRTATDTVLEPSCGDGRILQAAMNRLLFLGATREAVTKNIQAIELIPEEADVARARLRPSLGQRVTQVVQTGDFFAWKRQFKERRYTAVLGNPPFIRYQSFPEPSRTDAMKLMADAGLKPNRLTNIWVPFIVGAAETLTEGGRLAMVVPAELLQVSYAAQLRAFLTERFAHVGLIACNELFFEGAEQEVLLLLAEGARSSGISGTNCRVALAQLDSVKKILASDPVALLNSLEEKDVRGDSEKWLKYFLTAREIHFMREMRRHPQVAEIARFAEVNVGVVTGKNEFFVLRRSELKSRGLRNTTVPLVSRSAHLRGAMVSLDDWKLMAESDERVHLLNIRQRGGNPLSSAEAEYVKLGEISGFHNGYKCRIREPWFHVPAIWTPDGFAFRQIHDFPRFVRNRAGATSTDTIHRFKVRECDPDAFVASTFTHLTAASAEIEGRSYGGGVLELEPTEAERLLIPNNLGAAVPLKEADAYVRRGKLGALLKENDKRALRGALGLTVKDCALLKTIWEKLRDRRFARNKSARRA